MPIGRQAFPPGVPFSTAVRSRKRDINAQNESIAVNSARADTIRWQNRTNEA
jgi:hypothetical protein